MLIFLIDLPAGSRLLVILELHTNLMEMEIGEMGDQAADMPGALASPTSDAAAALIEVLARHPEGVQTLRAHCPTSANAGFRTGKHFSFARTESSVRSAYPQSARLLPNL